METLELQNQMLLKEEAQKLVWGAKMCLEAHHTEYLHGDEMETFHLNSSKTRSLDTPLSKQDYSWKLPQDFSQDLNTQWPPNSARGYQTNLMSKALQGSYNFKHTKSQLLAYLTQISDLVY